MKTIFNKKNIFICVLLLVFYSLFCQNPSNNFEEGTRARRKFSQNRDFYSPKNKRQELLQNPLQIINASVEKKSCNNNEYIVFNLVFNVSVDPNSLRNAKFFINGENRPYRSLKFNRVGTQAEIIFPVENNNENTFFSLKLKNIHSLNNNFLVELETEPMEVGTLYYKELSY